MEPILKILHMQTPELQLNHFQEILHFTQRIKKDTASTNNELQLFVQETSTLLWAHMNCVLPTTECQLICSTSFFTLLAFPEDITYHLQNVGLKISSYLSSSASGEHLNQKDKLIVISLIFGLYQSSFLSTTYDNDTIRTILINSLDVLVISAYNYSEFTFITFKTLLSLKKLLHSSFKDILLQKHNTLLKLTIHNWENPITGIRDLNKLVFGLVLEMDSLLINTGLNYGQLMIEINTFPWNKAKYLMLSEIIIRDTRSAVTMFDNNPDWQRGLFKSLKSSSLVSAGADMYLAVLKKTNTEKEWCHIFLNAVLKVLNGSEFKTIEHFNNYWCMNTLKLFPQVLGYLSDQLCSSCEENTCYAHVSIMRQGNRLGLLTKPWSDSDFNGDDGASICPGLHKYDTSFLETIRRGLEHINFNIRIQTFEIVCIAHNNGLPTYLEFDLILKFVNDNVNSDSTNLRLTMINNIKLFFTRLHTATSNIVKNKSDNQDLQHVLKFCVRFQNYLKSSLKMHGNYQRSVATTKLCAIFLFSFTKPLQRKRRAGYPITTNTFTLSQWLKEHQMWYFDDDDIVQSLLSFLNDPADDVRDTVSDILLTNYSENFNSPRIENLLQNSLKNIQSKYFYEVSSGHCGMKLVSNLLLQHKYDDFKFKSIKEFFYYFLDDFVTQINSSDDILLSIETGRPLHSLITILQNILEVCLQRSYPLIEMLTTQKKEILIDTLGVIPTLYSSEEDSACSPDFSEMSYMVDKLISQSACKVQTEENDVKISDLHQLVLNCIWLNLKACCEMLCTLVRCMDSDEDLQFAEVCLHAIAKVLESSRHKGAIEAAGVALGKSVKHLTSLPINLRISSSPMLLLQGHLEVLIGENKMGSITRRGAGLSIMLHRIVSNDAEKGKPLFHYAMQMLLKASRISETAAVRQDMCNERDIPKAIYIHLMTKIVADRSLASEVMYYVASLAEVAFSNLTSEQWQIRNAALQLYGALVPKLIGQKKAASADEDSAATVGCDEIRTHFPKLWIYIHTQLESQDDFEDIIQAHSNLVPTLNILASTAKRYNFSIDDDNHSESEYKLFKNLMRLLKSPIYSVRRLTAKSIELMYSFEMIYEHILNTTNVTENLLHGFLLLTKFCKKRLTDTRKQHSFLELEQYFKNILYNKNCSFVVKTTYDEIFWNAEKDYLKILKTTIDILNKNRHIPGAFIWANMVIEKCISHCESNDIPNILMHLLKLSDLEMYFKFILKRLRFDKAVSSDAQNQIVNIFKESENIFDRGGIWKILYEISKNDLIIFENNILQFIFEFLELQHYKVAHKIRFLIPFVAKFLTKTRKNQPVCDELKFSSLVHSLTDYEAVEVDMRYVVAIANNHMCVAIRTLSLDARVNVLKAAVNLLQDDDEDVRNEAAKCYSHMTTASFTYQPFICLQKILAKSFLYEILGDTIIILKFVCDLLHSVDNATVKDMDVKSYNPFVIETRNIYAEPQVLAHFLHELQRDLLVSNLSDPL